VQPFDVDVASGVEASPGLKDHTKLKAFIEAALRVPPAVEAQDEGNDSTR
jgi:phosphoribosylanthranilate isomerase